MRSRKALREECLAAATFFTRQCRQYPGRESTNVA